MQAFENAERKGIKWKKPLISSTFLIYGFFMFASCFFNFIPFPQVSGEKLVMLFSNFALIIFLIGYVFSVLMVFMGVSTPTSMMTIAAILGIIKFRKRKNIS